MGPGTPRQEGYTRRVDQNSGARLLGFKSQLRPFLAVWPSARDLTSLGLSYL